MSLNETMMEIGSISDLTSLHEALSEATAMINSSDKPVIVVGIEIHRFGLQEKLLQLIDKTKIPFVVRSIVIADVGDSLFGALDLKIHGQTEFLSPAYYCSMGFAVPASIGTQLANPRLRPVVIVGRWCFSNDRYGNIDHCEV